METARRRVPYLLPVGILLVLSALVRWHGQINWPLYKYDHYAYLAMAGQPLDNFSSWVHHPPFCWRVLTPFLARLLHLGLHLSIPAAFELLTVIGLAGATLGVMWFLRGLGMSHELAIAGGVTFVLLGSGVGFYLWYYLMVDPIFFALLTVALGATVRRNGPLLLAAIFLGTLDKETMLLAVAFAVIWALERRDWPLLSWAVLSGIVCAGTLVVLRTLIMPDRAYGYRQIIDTLIFNPTPIDGPLPERLLAASTGTWAFLLPVAMLQLVHSPRMARSYAVLALFLGATAQVAVSIDVERVVVSAFPVVIAACCWEVKYLADRLRCSPWLLWAVIWLLELPGMWLFGFHSVLGSAVAPFSFGYYAAETLVLAAVTACLLGWIAGRTVAAQRS